MNIELLTIEIRMLRYMHRYPCSVDMLISLLHPKQRWKIGYYLAHLEDLGLVEEISQQEIDAFWRGDNYKEMQICTSTLSGYYMLTDNGEFVLEQWTDSCKTSFKEVFVPVFTSILGAVLGYLLSQAH